MAVDNREYKDRLFNFLFGSEENKAWTLSLYNAVNGSNYTDPSAIEITTIQETMYISTHNDISFIIADEMNLYEQQSTYNPNMPVRMLRYAASLFEKYIVQTKQDPYGRRQMHLPVPQLVVFYNGLENQPKEKTLKLSDSFPEGAVSDIEVTVRMINVNYGTNPEFLVACKPLQEYSWLVNKIREINKEQGNEDIGSAIDQAISAMPDDFEIKPFLEAHRAEVKGMLLAEYNEAEKLALVRDNAWREGQAEGRTEGRAEGRAEGIIDTLISLVKKNLLSTKDAADQAGVSEAAFTQRMSAK